MHATTTTSLMRSTAAVGFLSLLQPMLHGCTAGPKAPPETAPPAADALLDTQSASVDASRQPAPRWWEDLHDATLDALIARAEAGNQTLAAAVANVRAAYAGVGASEAQLWPAVGVGAQYSRTLTNIAQLAAAGVRVEPYDMYAYGVGMQSWEIDLWGGVRRQIEAAEADAASKVDALRDALVSVRTQVAAVYVQVRTLQAQRAVLVANRDALAKSRDLVKARYDAGTTNLLDVSRAQAALDGVEAQVPQVDAGLASAVSQLAVLCGANPSEIAPLVAAVAPLPESPDVAGIGLPAEILERRPDVRAAKERLTAATAAIGVAEAARLPTVYVSGQFYIASNTVSGLGDLANKAYSIGPSLYLPLLDGGRIDSAVRQQRALAEAALAQYRQAMVTAIGDVSAGVGDFVHARESRRLADAAMESARSALVLANQQFDAGVIDFSTLLDVQRSALDAESSAVEARAGLVQGFVSLQRALGAGWSGDEPLVAQGEGRGETSVEHDRAGATGAGEENR